MAREAGAWTTDAETACFADLEAEMRRLEQDAPRSLQDASRDPAATRLVYSKGALFWMLVDARLRAAEDDTSRRPSGAWSPALGRA